MAVQVLIPTPLRKFTNNQETVPASPGTIASLITELESLYPGINKSLTDDQGELRRFVNVYVNEEDIRFLDGKNTTINDGDAVSIVPAIAGGW
jgi:molybdopterin converting factor small subunit